MEQNTGLFTQHFGYFFYIICDARSQEHQMSKEMTKIYVLTESS
jgi:hypothetical protein